MVERVSTIRVENLRFSSSNSSSAMHQSQQIQDTASRKSVFVKWKRENKTKEEVMKGVSGMFITCVFHLFIEKISSPDCPYETSMDRRVGKFTVVFCIYLSHISVPITRHGRAWRTMHCRLCFYCYGGGLAPPPLAEFVQRRRTLFSRFLHVTR